MKKENPVTYSLKLTTSDIINRMYVSGKFLSEKSACFEFYKIAKKKRLVTGFTLSSPQKFYDCYRKFISINHIKSQIKISENDIDSMFTALICETCID